MQRYSLIYRPLFIALVILLLLTGIYLFFFKGPAETAPAAPAYKYNVLFDNAHDETAGNADWVISKSQPDPLQENPHPQTESDWTGGLSSWGVTLQRTGRYKLMTNDTLLTYGGRQNPLDLTHFQALILPEPNIPFTYDESKAILSFVKNGGGLFMIADHNGSDRDNDGNDSLHIFNDLMNSAGHDVFGIQFDALDIYYDNPHNDTPLPDPLLKGPFGTARSSIIRDGTTETISPRDNPTVRGIIYISGVSTTDNTGEFVARSQYGKGRVVAAGDSSAIDDGTCEDGHRCEDGWDDPAGQNNILFPNGTAWLVNDSGR